MAKRTGSGIVGTVLAFGTGLHLLHEVADGYSWAYQLAKACPWCRARGQN